MASETRSPPSTAEFAAPGWFWCWTWSALVHPAPVPFLADRLAMFWRTLRHAKLHGMNPQSNPDQRGVRLRMYPRYRGLAAYAAALETFPFRQLHFYDQHLADARQTPNQVFPPQQHAVPADILREHDARFPALQPNYVARQPYRDARAAAAIHPANVFRVHDATLDRRGAAAQDRQ